ncbi:MAG TPA: hypothetical protein VK530_15965 [Candidatus Acidoferrum sp.]|nr:hypothetical protein [Candidatus Acidoferrum sp.]
MKWGNKRTVFITLTFTCAALLLAPSAQAAHAKGYLDEFTFTVTNALALSTNLTAAQHRALTTAAKALKRNTTTIARDLSALEAMMG